MLAASVSEVITGRGHTRQTQEGAELHWVVVSGSVLGGNYIPLPPNPNPNPPLKMTDQPILYRLTVALN